MLFNELKGNLRKDFSEFQVKRIALLGDSATQFLAKAIKAYGYEAQINFELFEADFDQFDRQILDANSELYHFAPEFVALYPCVEKLWNRFTVTSHEQRSTFSDLIISEIHNWWQALANHSRARVIHFNFVECSDPVFGHFSTRTPVAFASQVKRINFELMNLAQQHKHVFIADLAGLAGQVGYAHAHDPRLYLTSKVAFALDFLPHVAKAVSDIVRAVRGNVRKCVVLDLDNTLWGGVIGDDGIENLQIGELGLGHAFDSLQRWVKELKNRGIILAVCSKNEEDTAKQPFLEHPDMILRLEDIAVFIANWDNKAENIKRVQQTLNIGLDSIVFLDDNPFERNLVRQLLPAVCVPELPDDPSLFVPYLVSLNLFETASFSEEDLQRTRQYHDEARRVEAQKSFPSVDDYLKSLAMVSQVRAFDEFSVPRVAQLTQRSNQFNLRTVRYTEPDIERIRGSDRFITLSFDLKDKFGDHGLIGVVILEKTDARTAFIDTWIMSCRVLKRGMEEFIVNQMALHARAGGLHRLVGEYLPTAKNKMVKDLYLQMGFAPNNGTWELAVASHSELKSFISAV